MWMILKTCDWHASPYIAQVDMHDEEKNDNQRQSVTPSNGIFTVDKKSANMIPSVVLQLMFLFCILVGPIVAKTDIIVDWSPESVLFNKEHLVTKKFAKIGDQIVFDCPKELPISVLMVSKQDVLSCDVTNNFNQSLIGFCTPERNRINFVVRDFLLLPNVPFFKDGEEYYFISTSNGTESGMRNTRDGFCKTNGMRLALKISGKAAPKSDSNRNPDILISINNYFLKPNVIGNSQEHKANVDDSAERDPEMGSDVEDERRKNRVVTRPRLTASTTAPTIPHSLRNEANYPAYVVFSNNLSIFVQSERELISAIDRYRQTHSSRNMDYNIFPIKDLNKRLKGDSVIWEDPRYPPSRNTEYEIQGTASPLSSDHVPGFAVPRGEDRDVKAGKRRNGEERRGISRHQYNTGTGDSSTSLEDMLEYEIGYEDGLSSSLSSLEMSSILLTCTCLIRLLVG